MKKDLQWTAIKKVSPNLPQADPHPYANVMVAAGASLPMREETEYLYVADIVADIVADTNVQNSVPNTISVSVSVPVEKLLLQINHELATEHFYNAVALLAEQINQLLEHGVSIVQLQALLATIPTPFANVSADFCYCTAILQRRMGELNNAIAQLNHARRQYQIANRQSQIVRCIIDIARIYSSQENHRLAFQYLTDEAKPLIDRIGTMEAGVRAYYLLQMAHLATDIGHLNFSTGYAQQALSLYVEVADLEGQFASQLRIARNFMQCGKYRQADAHMQLVRQYFHIGKLGTSLEIQLLNAEIHLRWYQSQFDDAIHLTQLYLKIADHEQLRNARLYARILMANLYRDSHDYRRATKWYGETQQLITDFGHTLYQPWLDAQQAWLYLIQDELDQAHLYVSRSLQTADAGQRMSFQVQQAILNVLQGRFTTAEKLLQESLTFYTHSGDPLAICAIRIYLAYIALKQEDSGTLLVHLIQIFTCFEQLEIDSLPYWWHPQIVTEICCQAILADISPTVVKKIITQRLGQQSALALTKLLRIDDLDVRQQAQHLIGAITGQNMTVLAHLTDGPAKQILQNQIESGQLRVDGYLQLESALVTAKQRRHPNATLIAVFALHVVGIRRGVIAERLECSVENVRNYITKIYQHFALPASAFHSREERRQRLVKIARERGYIQ